MPNWRQADKWIIHLGSPAPSKAERTLESRIGSGQRPVLVCLGRKWVYVRPLSPHCDGRTVRFRKAEFNRMVHGGQAYLLTREGTRIPGRASQRLAA